ncbi:dihydrolipoyl dehydrogenase [Candidatus Woesearchaeota archaeon]|nr:dihydrolipoyl dehydrogenase [Candidatus Woesearchaeota archaeon]
MQKFDLIVIGGGSGLSVSSAAAAKGMKVAVVEEGPLGGTCLNRGCIPSKMLIHAADVAETITSAGKFWITAKYQKIDFQRLVHHVSSTVDADAQMIERGNKSNKSITLFKGTGRFIAKKTLQVGNQVLTAEKIVIAAGTRPLIPQIPGLDKVKYLTSTEALRLKRQPKSIIMIGGGYISCELAHFFGSLGTKVTIIEFMDRLVGNEDNDISAAFTSVFSQKHTVLLGYKAVQVAKKGKLVAVTAQKGKAKKTIAAEELLVAVGRIPNTDILDVGKAGVKTTPKGYVQVDEHLQASVPGIWALGDIAGNYFFKHSANLEAQYVWWNLSGHQVRADYTAMPHAIFSSPQIAGVGYTEQELQQKGVAYKKAIGYYRDVAMGLAFRDTTSFVKALASPDGKILGCHIMGPEASTLIHEVVVAMKNGGRVTDITGAVHVHPALPEIVQRTFLKVR